MLKKILDLLITPLAAPRDLDAEFREAIVHAANGEWLSPQDVSVYRRDKGWHTEQPDWCGEFAGYCAGRAGLASRIRKYVTPSTYRLFSPDLRDNKWQKAGYPRPAAPPPGDVRRGDLICVVTGANKAYGDHIAIVYDVLGDSLYTYEGNARGLLPDGRQGRGVVRQVRKLEDVRQVIRFTAAHMGP